MTKRINCFIPFGDEAQTKETVKALRKDVLTGKIYLMNVGEKKGEIEGCESICVPSIKSTEAVRKIAEKADSDYTLIYTKESTLEWVHFAMERMVNIGDDTGADLDRKSVV